MRWIYTPPTAHPEFLHELDRFANHWEVADDTSNEPRRSATSNQSKQEHVEIKAVRKLSLWDGVGILWKCPFVSPKLLGWQVAEGRSSEHHIPEHTSQPARELAPENPGATQHTNRLQVTTQ